MPSQRDYVLEAVRADAQFIARFVTNARETDPELLTHLLFAAAPWISTSVYESGRALQRVGPGAWTAFGADAARIAERARHGLKLFEDTHRSIDDYEVYFADIAREHRAQFLDTVPADYRMLADDLGVTTINGDLLYTTHAVAFALGMEPAAAADLTEFGLRLHRAYTEFGAYFARLSPPDGQRSRFLDRLHGFDPSMTDVRSEQYYASCFTGTAHPYLNAVLLHFEGLTLGTVSLFPFVAESDATERYAVFKARWVVALHVLRSLRKLRDRPELDTTGRAMINAVLDAAPIDEQQRRPFRDLRNLLVHYVPAPTQLDRIDATQPILEQTLAAAAVPDSVADLSDQLDRTLLSLVAMFSDWHRRPAR